MDQAPIMPKSWKPSQKTSAPVMPKDWGKEEVMVEKKKPTALPSPSAKPAVSSVAGLHPMVPSSESKSVAKPIAKAEPKPIAKSIAKAETKPTAKPITKTIAKVAPAQQKEVSVIPGQSQGKLLIPEPMQKVPAVTETITTFKNKPIVKADKGLVLDPELMLKAIFKNEQGETGKVTKIKGRGVTNTASGKYQMTDETKRNVFNNSEEFQKEFGNYNSFLKEFNKNPSLEFDAALSHMSDLVKQYGKYALAAWYSPSHAAQAANGNLRALDVVPRRDAGNKQTVRTYYNNALSELKKISKDFTNEKDYIKVPVSKKVVKEPAVEVPSLEKFNVLSPNWYGGPVSKEQEPVAPKKVGALEDIGNTFMSSVNKMASTLVGAPYAANQAALMVTTKLLGIDDEYNALPIQAKKEVGDIMSTITQRGGVPPSNISKVAQEYFIKKSDEFVENTNKSDKYLNQKFGDFFKNPSVDKAAEISTDLAKGFAGSLPYMINPYVGAVSSGLERYSKDVKDAEGKLGWGQLVNAGITGVTEYQIEKIASKILNQSVREAIGLPKVAKEFAEGWVKSVLKDVGLESAGEGATEFIQSLSDDITHGRDIDWYGAINRSIDASITGGAIASGMRGTGAGVGYLAKKIMPKSDSNIIDRNTSAIMDLNTKKGPDNSPQVNAVIDSKINELNKANINIINNSVDKAKSLSDDQIREVVGIDSKIDDIYKQRDAVVADPNLTDEEKQSLLDHLKAQATTLNQQKDAIQKQTTSEVPVQPEAGTSLQVAEGKSQTEPQVTTQEGKGQEVTPAEQQTPEPVIATVDVTTPVKFEEGQMPEMSVDQIDWEASGMGTRQEAIDKFGGINDITVVDIQEKNDKGQYVGRVRVLGQDNSKEGVVVFKDPNAPEVTEEVPVEETPKNTKFEAAKQLLKDKGVYPITDRINGIMDLAESKPGEVTAEDVQTVLKVNNTKAKSIANALNKQAKQEAKAAEQEVVNEEKQKKEATKMSIDQAMEKAKSEGLTKDLIADAGLEALRQTEEYKQAEQQDRDLMEDGVRKKAGLKRKAAPSAKKILGITDTKQLVKVMSALKDQIKLEGRAAKEAVGAFRDKVSELVNGIKSLGKSGKLTPAQTRTLVNIFNSNLMNPVIFDRVMARAKRIITNSQYAQKVSDANAIRTRLRKILAASKNKKLTQQLQDKVKNMVEQFVKVAPKMVEDIDQYMEMAEMVEMAVRNPKITSQEVIDRVSANINDVNKYSQEQIDKQEEDKKQELMAQFDYLVEAGVIDKDMSYNDIKNIVDKVIDEGVYPSGSTDLQEQGLVFFRMKFNDYAEIIKKMLDGTDPITGEAYPMSEGDKKVVRDFLSIDPEKINDLATMFNITDAAQEFITNGIIDKMDAMTYAYKGEVNVANDAANPEMKAYKPLLPFVANISKLGPLERVMHKKMAPIQEFLRNIFRSSKKAAEFEKSTGFTGIMNAFSRALKIANDIDVEYSKLFKNKKPNGKKFNDISNTYERGIYADLYRTTFGDQQEVDKEFNRKKEQLELTIKELLSAEESHLVKEGEILQKIYDSKVKDANNIDDLRENIDPINQQAVEWWESTWEENYDEFDRVAKSVYNLNLKKENHYTPETWRKISKEISTEDNMLTRSLLKMNRSYVDTKSAGTLRKYQYSPGLPVNDAKEVTHVKSYDFDANNSDSFSKTLKDVYTAPHIIQYAAYTSSPNFKNVIPNKATRALTKDKMDFAINAMKDRQSDNSDEAYRQWNKWTKNLTSIGRAQGLVSLKAPILQTIPVLASTASNLVDDPMAIGFGIKNVMNPDALKSLAKSGYGIASRGLEAITALEAADKVLHATTVGDLNPLEPLKKISNETLKYVLSKPDVFAAKFAWLSYYANGLKKQGINPSNINWENHEFNEEAANYAERQVNSKLNQSTQELSGEMFSSRKQKDRFYRNMLLTFASYSYNLKYRFWTDMTILGSKNSNLQEKYDAAKDVVGTVAEGAAYSYLSVMIGEYVYDGLLSLIGYDEPEDDKKKREDNALRNVITRGFTDLFSPMPGLGDRLLVYVTNQLLGGDQEKPEKNKEKLFFVNKKEEPEKEFRFTEYKGDAADEWLSILGGLPGIYGKNLYATAKTFELLHQGEKYTLPNGNEVVIPYKDKFGNDIEFSDKEKENMKTLFALQALGNAGLLFRDQAEAANKMRTFTEKRAKKRTATSKKEKLFYVPKAE